MEEIKNIIDKHVAGNNAGGLNGLDQAAKEITLLMMEAKGNCKYKSETIRLADELGFLIRLNEEIKTAHFGEGASFNLSQIHRMVEHRKGEIKTQLGEINKEIDSLKKL